MQRAEQLSEEPTTSLAVLASPNRTTKVVLSSFTAALCATFVGYPLDTVKTRLQTYKYPNFWQCITTTYAESGLSAFYRGITASIISGSTARAFTMSLYTSLLPAYASLLGVANERSTVVTFASGMTAGAASTLFTCPFEFTKVASQVEALVYRSRGLPEPKSMGTLRAVKDLLRRGGFMRLYGGYRYHLMRDSLGSAIYFSVYEHAKQTVGSFLPSEDSKPNPLAVATAGGVCGVISWVAVYPIDTMKSHYQRDLYHHSLASSMEFRDTVVERPKFKISLHMYRGLGFSILRTSLNGMVLFSVYEYLMHLGPPAH
ncbi:putative mitochondrial carrier C29A3.11c [Wickerhamiella sorbophila]|uniref:Putative mitochondrial carrier C29A3.11c n=1 Tax=Wickerhamiella sorbophila TaxID=45607 RepID=A0A2T0FED9_9ASCO|nr:putative mitochondrial carrier C29A3.11c [Wickerhamiella sorbophila]PRT53341.1 putative mitochondrial carrier C29A3.11c [Wickerhamiella sorbophila]